MLKGRGQRSEVRGREHERRTLNIERRTLNGRGRVRKDGGRRFFSSVQRWTLDVGCWMFDVRISCLNSRVGDGVWGGGKSGGWVDQREVYPPARKPQELFSKLLVLISDGFPGMGGWRVRTAAEQVGEHLRAELCRGAWGGRMPGGSRLAVELGVGRDTVEAVLRLLEQVSVSDWPRPCHHSGTCRRRSGVPCFGDPVFPARRPRAWG